MHLITLLEPGFLRDLEFVNHTISNTKAKTTSLHQALSRRPLSHSYQKEPLKSFCSLTSCTSNHKIRKPILGPGSISWDTNLLVSEILFPKRGSENITQQLTFLTLVFPCLMLMFFLYWHYHFFSLGLHY